MARPVSDGPPELPVGDLLHALCTYEDISADRRVEDRVCPRLPPPQGVADRATSEPSPERSPSGRQLVARMIASSALTDDVLDRPTTACCFDDAPPSAPHGPSAPMRQEHRSLRSSGTSTSRPVLPAHAISSSWNMHPTPSGLPNTSADACPRMSTPPTSSVGESSGLIDALDKFDPARGSKFESYAVSRIRGRDHRRHPVGRLDPPHRASQHTSCERCPFETGERAPPHTVPRRGRVRAADQRATGRPDARRSLDAVTSNPSSGTGTRPPKGDTTGTCRGRLADPAGDPAESFEHRKSDRSARGRDPIAARP